MAHKKLHLPEKLCPVCNRTFKWRKKWEKEWDNVKYCSEKCRRNKIKGINQTPTFQFPPHSLFSIGLFFREAYFFSYFALQVPALFHLYCLFQTR